VDLDVGVVCGMDDNAGESSGGGPRERHALGMVAAEAQMTGPGWLKWPGEEWAGESGVWWAAQLEGKNRL